VVVADHRKNSRLLGEQWKKGIPIEVLPEAYVPVMRTLTQSLGAMKVTLRMAPSGKAGPVVTDNGNFVVDADFGVLQCAEVANLNSKLIAIPGVVETGLFVNMAHKAFFGNADGSVTSTVAKNRL